MSDLSVEVADGVAVWTINRPPHNTIGGTLLADFLAASAEASADDRVRAVVTAAEGPNWCVGAELADLERHLGAPLEDLVHGDDVGGAKGMPLRTGPARRLDRLGIGRWVLEFRAMEKPLIAAVDGPAAGGGFALLALHDIRLASERARFSAGFVTVGVGPEMGLSWLLPRMMGPAAALDLLLTGRLVGAEEALAAGIVQRVVAPGEVLGAALEYAARLARLPALAVQAAVAAVRASPDNTLQAQLEVEWRNSRECFADPGAAEAVKSLIERQRRRGREA